MPSKKVIKKKPLRTHRTSVASKDAKGEAENRRLSTGHEERLNGYVKRALELKRLRWTHVEIAEALAEEFNLTSIPPITTVADWLKRGNEAVARDIRELQWQMRIEQFTDLERLKSKWMHLATAYELEIKRWVRIEGELQPELDENAVKEQIEATKQVVAIMARQAKLLGLDLEKSLEENGEGPGSLQELQIWLIGQVNLSTGAPNGKAIDIQAEILELKAGIPEIDAV